ncbi:MAG: response regulator [Arcobacteraceae bacterium]
MYLVVDDSKMARKMAVKNLTLVVGNDVSILEAENGLEAFELYKEHRPSLCLMDLTMPVMDGFEAIDKICNFDKDAKIIVISADIQELSMKKAKDNGAIGFIKKPVNEESLKKMITALGLV